MIIVDFRERNLINKLNEKDINFNIEKLDVGDVIVGDVVIERKTSRDLEDSIIDGRLFKQLKNLRNYCENVILLIEGNSFFRLHRNAIRGAILTSILDFKINVIQTKDINETCEIIKILEKRQNKISKNIKLVNLKKEDPEKIRLMMLTCLPGVSYKKAKTILSYFKTIKNFVNSIDEIDKIDGIGKKTKSKISKVIEDPSNETV